MRRKSSLLILLGVLLLAAAGGVAAMSLRPSGNSLLAVNTPQEPPVDPMLSVVVAQIDLEKGTLINAPDEYLSTSEVPASQFNAQTQFSDPQALRDMVLTADVKAGETINSSVVRQAGLAQKIPEPEDGQPSLRAFPIQVNNLSGVADLIQSGDFVDVLGSFRLDVTTLYANGQGGVSEKTSQEGTTKVLLQDVEVLDVVKMAAPVNAENAEQEQEAPSTDTMAGETTEANVVAPKHWFLLLAVTSDEAEILRFTLNHGINLTTVLRRTGDHTIDETIGTTMEILTETYGQPKPRPVSIDQYGDLPSPNTAPAAPQSAPDQPTP